MAYIETFYDVFMRFAAVVALCTALSSGLPANFENMRLFERLGLGRTADGDSSPRISSVKTPGNSPMFFIRLPPSPYYYNLNEIGTDGRRSTPKPNFARVPVQFNINVFIATTTANLFRVVPARCV
ncbi:hypothetical protein FJT64_025264 [Amphibalanus amphitrite]|uniref:Uncharacterized protein n=1 Tax=Amphibalanus amphitrite TaxID=1232801 RepID=A0A6A4WIV6_AMPAM|nr:hypothetical protein FJT64_025264 [Amphibalanus amphitrite]